MTCRAVRHGLAALLALAAAGCGPSAHLAAYRRDLAPAPPDPAEGVRVTWLGTAGLLVTDGETAFLIDPFVSRYGLGRVGFALPLPPRADLVDGCLARLGHPAIRAVLVSHSHYDHALDAPLFAARTGAPLVGSESTANIGLGAGLPTGQLRVVQGGDTLALGRFRVTFLASEHGKALAGRVPYPGTIDRPLVPPAPASAYRLGATFSIVVEHPAGSFLHHGSAGWRPGMFDGVRVDTVLLGLAGRASTADLLEHVVDPVGARTVVPIHFDDFFRALDAPMAFLVGVDYAEFAATTRRMRPALRVVAPPLLRAIVPGGG